MLRRPCSLASVVVCVAGLACLFAPSQSTASPPPSSDSFVVTGARIFDGEHVLPQANLVVRRGRIVALGPHVPVPVDLPVVDGRGATLLPGLIDAHSHARTRGELERALVFGVTTELDMWTLPQFAARMRREQARTGAPDRADFLSAGNPATTPEGYPYNFSPQVEPWTLDSPEEARAFVAKRLAEGSDYLKLMLEDGTLVFLDLPILDRPTVRALVDAIHARGKIAVAHVTEQDRARDAVLDGVDGLAHIFVDEIVDPELAQLMRSKGTFVVATLNTEEAFVTTAGGQTLVADPHLGPYLTDEEIQSLLTPGPPSLITEENLAFGRESVRRLAALGVPILAGTDVATHGVSLHRDLELLVLAGLTPLQALQAATANPAAAFGLSDRGRLAPGQRADLLLVEGDPTTDILQTRAIRGIWKGGVAVARPLP